MELIYLKLILLIILIFITVLLFIPIHLSIEVKRKKQDHVTNIRIKMLKGLIKLNYDISYNNIVKNGSKFLIKGKKEEKRKDIEKSQEENKLLITISRIEGIFKNIEYYLGVFKEAIKYIVGKLEISSLKFYLKFGVGDAALTAILYGLFWSIIGLIFNVILISKETDNININIYPDFSERIYEVDFLCIIKIKIVHIIIAGFKGLKVFIKGGVLNA